MLQNFLVIDFAIFKFFALLSSQGARFQSLVASPINVFGVSFSLNFSAKALLVVDPFTIGMIMAGFMG